MTDEFHNFFWQLNCNQLAKFAGLCSLWMNFAFPPWLTHKFRNFFPQPNDEFFDILKGPIEEFHDFFSTIDWWISLFFLMTGWQNLRFFSFYQLVTFVFFLAIDWQNLQVFFKQSKDEFHSFSPQLIVIFCIFHATDWRI